MQTRKMGREVGEVLASRQGSVRVGRQEEQEGRLGSVSGVSESQETGLRERSVY